MLVNNLEGLADFNLYNIIGGELLREKLPKGYISKGPFWFVSSLHSILLKCLNTVLCSCDVQCCGVEFSKPAATTGHLGRWRSVDLENCG